MKFDWRLFAGQLIVGWSVGLMAFVFGAPAWAAFGIGAIVSWQWLSEARKD